VGIKRIVFATTALAVAVIGIRWAPLRSQSTPQAPTPDWQIAAGNKMAFDTASVTQNTSGSPGSSFSFPLGPGDVYIPTGGRFRAANVPLSAYIFFGYKVTDNQEQFLLSQLPKWVTTDRFDIQANAQGNPTKDQMRLMMQALLADRFRLAVHHETRKLPVYALLLEQPGKFGPLLQKHAEGSPCPTTPFTPSPAPDAPPQTLDARFPLTCGGIVGMTPSVPGRFRAGARNISMELLATSLTGGASGLDRPVVDRTGLSGKYDFAIEFTPQANGPLPSGAKFSPDPSGPTFVNALREQLGLRLEAETGPVDMLVVDYIEPPAAN
jgi:uncharacterized protein (TIGR03435 family)